MLVPRGYVGVALSSSLSGEPSSGVRAVHGDGPVAVSAG